MSFMDVPGRLWMRYRLLHSLSISMRLPGWSSAGRLAGLEQQRRAWCVMFSTVCLSLGDLTRYSRCHRLFRLLGCTVVLCGHHVGCHDGSIMPSLPRGQPQETSQKCQGCRGSQTELPRRRTPPTLEIGDDSLDEWGCHWLLLGRKASNKSVGAENIQHSRAPLSIAHNTPQGCGGKEWRSTLGYVR